MKRPGGGLGTPIPSRSKGVNSTIAHAALQQAGCRIRRTEIPFDAGMNSVQQALRSVAGIQRSAG
jgi:hypothetical protein